MATCKDCIHYEVCKTEKGSTVFYREGLLESTYNQVDKLCGALFKDKSRFVELPCKLGDEIFYTIRGKIYQAIVDRIELYDEGVAIITTDGYCPDSSICYHTQEEAEQALKECEINGYL